MSTTSSTVPRSTIAAGELLAMAGTAIKRWWGAYILWRIERAAIVQLQSMSDRELRDIGLSRSQIVSSVKGGIVRDHDRSVMTHA